MVPEAIAHLSGDRTLTYEGLHRHSDELASYLTERLGDDRRPIAVLGHREPEMLIAFLGAVKSGRPYVPIDTALPQARIDQILASSRDRKSTRLNSSHLGISYAVFCLKKKKKKNKA